MTRTSRARSATDKRRPPAHRTISRYFERVGIRHRNEVALGPFQLDLVVGDKLVVEVDGPTLEARLRGVRSLVAALEESAKYPNVRAALPQVVLETVLWSPL